VVAAASGLALVAGTVLPVAMSGAAMAAEPATSVPRSAERPNGPFGDPSTANRPLYRFWHTGGLMTQESIARQVRQIRASGAGGFEANQLTRTIETAAGYHPETMSWGTPAWIAAQQGLFEEGRRAGLRVDTIYTPGWSAGTQDIFSDGRGAA